MRQPPRPCEHCTMNAITLYGIPNCDTVRKARSWLDARGISCAFHDLRREGLPEAALDRWIAQLGWEALLNRRGTTWRQLPATRQAAVVDAASARLLMLAQVTVIKRPVIEWSDTVTVGFEPAAWPVA